MNAFVQELCNGCGACVNICPEQCICLEEKHNITVTIDKDKCINCELCHDVCPINSKIYPKAYAAYALDSEIVMQSSSGGMFSILANYILEHGGVVFGAAFDDNYEVHHIGIDNKAELDKLRRSKYVKSRIENTFSETEINLKTGRKVLFSGTGCQIEGLLAYLDQKSVDTTLLYTQDIICHGTVMPEVWRKYLDEKRNEYESEIRSISFRSKKISWFNFGINIQFENGREYFCDKNKDIYMKLFLENYSLNECCYNCSCRGIRRKSDITLADFWSVYRNEPTAFNPDGTSVVLVNSNKGRMLFDLIKDKIFYKDVSVNDISRSEVMLVTTVKKPNTRTRFLDMLNGDFLHSVYEKCNKLKFGVWGSFNLRCIANRCGETSYQISNNSIISLFSSPANDLDITYGSNSFRNEMLRFDIAKKGIQKLEQEFNKIDYLLIDFLEERFGILDLGNGQLLTDSDALRDTKFNALMYHKSEFTDDGYLKIWEKACEKFIVFLKDNIPPSKVILIRMFLSQRVSDGTLYPEHNNLRLKNTTLSEMYRLFEEICMCQKYPVNVITIPESLMYTQLNHKYGLLPEHFSTRAELLASELLNRLL